MKIDPQYEKLMEQLKVEGEQYAADAMKNVYGVQKSSLDEIHKYLGLLYVRNSVDGLLNVTPAQKKNILASLNGKLTAMGKNMGAAEVKTVTDILSHNYSDTYYKTAYVMDSGLKAGIKFDLLKPEYIDAAVNNPIDGELFSDRIWSNKADVATKVKAAITDALSGKTTIDKVGQQIQHIFNVGAYNSGRLVQTENARVQSTAIDNIGKSAGCSQQMFNATLEANTCSECAEYDGNYYDINDDSKPDIPLHPKCRCLYINVPPVPGWKPIQRRDNETGKDIGYKDYAQWAADKGIKNDNDYENNLVGLKASNGITVTELSQHFGERSIERDVEREHVADALTNPLKVDNIRTDEQGRRSQRFIGEKATVNINPDTGVITTAWKTSKGRAKKLKGGK